MRREENSGDEATADKSSVRSRSRGISRRELQIGLDILDARRFKI
jgi:hypothetical protein